MAGGAILKNIFTGIFSPVIDGVVGLGKAAIDSKEKQNEFMHEVEKLKLQAQTDFTDWYYKDKQRASEMYATDNSLQKIYALTFLVGFILLSAYLVIVMAKLAHLPDYAIALVSGILGSFTSKLNTNPKLSIFAPFMSIKNFLRTVFLIICGKITSFVSMYSFACSLTEPPVVFFSNQRKQLSIYSLSFSFV